MRKTKQETARTRERIVEAAAARFRENGIEGTGLSDLMAAAGLTQGGFYRHFQSKDELTAEAFASAVASELQWIAGPPSAKENAIEALAASYLSPAHRDDRSGGCPFAALGSEVVRSGEEIREAATKGLLEIIELIAPRFGNVPSDLAKQQALVVFSAMVGAMTLARMVTDSGLSNRLLKDASKQIGAVAQRQMS